MTSLRALSAIFLAFGICWNVTPKSTVFLNASSAWGRSPSFQKTYASLYQAYPYTLFSGGGFEMTFWYACLAASHLLGSLMASLKNSSPNAKYALEMYFEF